MDAITLLRNDHRALESLFKDFERAGDRAFEQKRHIVDRILEELSIHAAIEEQVLYPVARATVTGAEDMVLESLEEHHIVKWTMSELAKLEPEHERFDAKVTVLMESVRHHVKEEEGELFPKLRDQLGRNALADLGEELATAKQTAPTSPHPRWPDEPATAGASGVSGVVSRVEGNIADMAQGGMRMVQDLIDRIRGAAKPTPAKKAAVKKAVAATKTAAKKVAAKKAPAKKAVAKKATAKKAPAKKAAARKSAASRPAAAKRASTRPAPRATKRPASRATKRASSSR